jgi:uncharacterized protein
MQFRFHFYADAKGEYRWRLVSRNGRTVADSGEGYKTHAGVVRAAKRLQDAMLVLRVKGQVQ